MKNKRSITSATIAAVILMMASIAWAVPGVIVEYHETDLGGSWQYNYTIYNTSTEGEGLHEVYLYFTHDAALTGISLPAGWDGLPWTGSYTISYLNSYSTDFAYDLLSGEAQGGFSFDVDYRAGDISYVAYFFGDKQISGTTSACTPVSLYRDFDLDGYGNPGAQYQDCIASEGYVTDNTDCDDTDPVINPGTLWHPDSDEDGYGSTAVYLQQCAEPAGYILDNSDCDDTDPAINPDTLWYQDNDGDGYGTYILSLQQCSQPGGPPGYVLNKLDFDDNSSSIGPPTRINGGTPSYYMSLQEAYNLAADGDTIQCVNVTFAENLTINAAKSVTLEGGYNGAYSTITGVTSLQGDINITDGTVNIRYFELLQ